MLTESKIDKLLLGKVIQETFGISVINLTLVPRGEFVRAYIIESSNRTNFFLKIYSNDNVPDSAFRFAYDLFAKAGIRNIAHPIATSYGQMRIHVGDFQIALFNLINGKTAQERKLTDRQLERLGELLAKIHRSKTVVGEYSVKENLEIGYKARFLAVFNEMSKIADNATQYKKGLKGCSNPTDNTSCKS